VKEVDSFLIATLMSLTESHHPEKGMPIVLKTATDSYWGRANQLDSVGRAVGRGGGQ
jgi:hypothetical protein